MRDGYAVRQIDPRDHDRWTRLVSGSESGSVYALPAYLETLCEATGGHYSIVGVFRGDELVGGMPVYLERRRLGLVAVPRTLLTYQGPVIRDYLTSCPSEREARQEAILSALEPYLRTVACVEFKMTVRHAITDVRPFLGGGWHVRPCFTYLVPTADPEAAWGRLDQNLRRQIRRALGHGLVHTDDDDFESFYRLHLDTHRRKGSPIYLPRAMFQRFIARLRAQDLCRLYHARLPGGQSVAAQLVLTGPHRVSHTVCAASDGRHLSVGATPFLRWRAFASLSALGYAANDLSGATRLDPVQRFKRQWGGELVINWSISRPLPTRYRLLGAVVRAVGRLRSRLPTRGAGRTSGVTR